MKLLSIKDKEVVIFTDGSSRGNPGPGGYGAIAIYQNASGELYVDEIGGRENETTNNRMELRAAIEALDHFTGYYADISEYTFTIYLDSSYVLNGITKWVHGWKKNNWKTGGSGKNKEDVKNRDLWITLDALVSKLRVKFVHIQGHAGIFGNERCDEIATSYADNKVGKKTANDETFLYSGLLAEYIKKYSEEDGLEGSASHNISASADSDFKNILNIEPNAEALEKKKKVSSRKSSSSAKAYSYVSLVDGKIHIDHDWKTCEARVKGKSGARFKKTTNPIEESEIVASFSGK